MNVSHGVGGQCPYGCSWQRCHTVCAVLQIVALSELISSRTEVASQGPKVPIWPHPVGGARGVRVIGSRLLPKKEAVEQHGPPPLVVVPAARRSLSLSLPGCAAALNRAKVPWLCSEASSARRKHDSEELAV